MPSILMNYWRKNLKNHLENHKSARDALLQKISSALQADPRFVAAWLSGSLGRHGGDALSDIDITVVVDSKHVESLCQRPWMVAGRTTEQRLALFGQFGQPVIIHENHHNAPENGTFTCVIYGEDAVTVDWTLVPEDNVTLPPFHVVLFKKIEVPHQKPDSAESRQERAQAASEKVAFFWMMMTVMIKYMLRRDVVYFHMLLDSLHRVLIEVTWLVEGRTWQHHNGSLAKLAVTYREQVAAIRDVAVRMYALMPRIEEMGGHVPDDPMRVIRQLLVLNPVSEPAEVESITNIIEAEREKAMRVIQALEGTIGKRIRMYIGSNDPEDFSIFLTGFGVAFGILGIGGEPSGPDPMAVQVWRERGWTKYRAAQPYQEMLERGMDNDSIIQEMIAIQVETWKRTYNIK
jgi:hypothetical protein